MKILRISLRNIASLAGTHTVDFTTEPLRSAGLFSISGKTGSGKSTLLDALCLALYDDTPRLKNVGRLDDIPFGENAEKQKDAGSLLRRGSGEGFAEVAFEGADGKVYTSQWKVRRARQQSTGKLQAADMTLYRGHITPGADGEIECGGRKTLVKAAIQEKIGLTFQQFTRAVLLAQNEFSAFLKAEDHERAKILEALTGTERFGTISKAVYDRHAQEKKTIDRLADQLEDAAPLSDEDRQTADEELQLRLQQLRTVQQRTKELKAHADWFVALDNHQQKVDTAAQQLAAAEQQLVDSKPRVQELEHTHLIQREARSLRAAEKSTATSLAETVRLHKAAITALKTQQQLQQQVLKQLAAATEELQQQKTAFTELQPQLTRARVLDAKLEPAAALVAGTKKANDSAELELKAATQQRNDTKTQQKKLTVEQQDRQQQAAALQSLTPFASATELWLERLQTAAAATTALATRTAECDKAARDRDAQQKQLLKKERDAPELQTAVSKASTAFDKAAENAAKYDAEQLSHQRTTLAKQRETLGELKHHLDKLWQLTENSTSTSDEIQELQRQSTLDQQTLDNIQAETLPLAQSTWDIQQSLLKKMQAAIDDDAKRLRATLETDQPCSVCGSVEHPYREHAPDYEISAVRTGEAEVAESKASLDSLVLQVRQLESQRKSAAADIEKKRIRYKTQLQNIEDERRRFPFAEEPVVAQILALTQDLQLPELKSQLIKLDAGLQQNSESETARRTAEKQLTKCQTQLQTAKDVQAKHTEAVGVLKGNLQLADSRCENETRNVQAAETTCTNVALPLKELWAALPDAEAEFNAAPDEFRRQFAEQTHACNTIQQRLTEIKAEQTQLNDRLELLQVAVENAAHQFSETSTAAAAAAKEHAVLAEERGQLFAGRFADDVERLANDVRDKAAEIFEQLTADRNTIDKAVVKATTDENTTAIAATDARSKRDAAELHLQQWLATFTKKTERELNHDQLDEMLGRGEAWLATESMALQSFHDRVKTCEGTQTTLADQRQQHILQRPTQHDAPQIQADLDVATAEHTSLSGICDAARSVLVGDDAKRKQSADRTTQLAEKRQAARPFSEISELIGSKDGARFRNIAQRQTLDILLSYANAHLRQLSDRYQLQRLSDSLNLIVIDLHMDENSRSVHSLSGGESFLVSLALALGLASLTSNRLRIESLFIDEGFGSLDQETLSIAMDALTHLEAQGRKVGVISHVTEMTDSIHTQIRIVPGPNGSSKVVVPQNTVQENEL